MERNTDYPDQTIPDLPEPPSITPSRLKSSFLPWFRFYARDWIADTACLSLPARGALITLIAHEWASGGLPVGDNQVVSRALGCSLDEWSAVREDLWPLLITMARELIRMRAESESLVAEKAKARQKGGTRKSGKCSSKCSSKC